MLLPIGIRPSSSIGIIRIVRAGLPWIGLLPGILLLRHARLPCIAGGRSIGRGGLPIWILGSGCTVGIIRVISAGLSWIGWLPRKRLLTGIGLLPRIGLGLHAWLTRKSRLARYPGPSHRRRGKPLHVGTQIGRAHV